MFFVQKTCIYFFIFTYIMYSYIMNAGYHIITYIIQVKLYQLK